MSKLTYFHALPAGAVDFSAGTINGVSVLTVGPALGHNIQIDRTGLEQCLAACQQRGQVKLIDRHDAEFDGIVGSISNFRIEGDQVKGDISLLENHPDRALILETASKLASEFGLSIECDSLHIDAPDGKGKLFRCSNVDAVALVPRPAANKGGFFSAQPFDKPKKDIRKFSDMSKLKTALSKFATLAKFEEGDELDNVLDAIVEAVQESQPSVEDRLKKLEEGAAAPKVEPEAKEGEKLEEGDKKDEEGDKKEESQDEKMAQLASKIVADQITKFATEFGIKRAPASGSGFEVADDRTKLSAELSALKAAGAKSDAEAIFKLSRTNPAAYNQFRAAGLL